MKNEHVLYEELRAIVNLYLDTHSVSPTAGMSLFETYKHTINWASLSKGIINENEKNELLAYAFKICLT